MLDKEARDSLSTFRIERAAGNLEEAKLLFANAKYNGSAACAYYAIFNSLRAILATEGVDFKKHSGVISYFQKQYIKTGIFEREISDYVRDAFAVRNDSDYKDFYLVSEEDAGIQIENADTVIEAVKKYLSEKSNVFS